MDEAKRAVRYILPGIIYIFLTSFTLAISQHSFFEIASTAFERANLEVIISTLVISGGLGYLFSLFYFVFWSPYKHLTLVQELIKSEKLIVTSLAGKVLNKLKEKDAWIIMNTIWDERKDSDFKGTNHRIGLYSDLLSGLGATIVALLASAFTHVLVLFYFNMNHKCLSIPLIGFILSPFIYTSCLFAAFYNYREIRRNYTRIINTSVATFFSRMHNDNTIPITIALDKSDYEKE